MHRDQLAKMTLEALRVLAAEQGLDGARSMGRKQLIDHLTPPAPEPAAEAASPADATLESPPPATEVHEIEALTTEATPAVPEIAAPASTTLESTLETAPAEWLVVRDAADPMPPDAGDDALPERYGIDHVGMLLRDPGRVFVYWELTAASRARLDGARAVLRLRLAGTDHDVECPAGADHGRLYVESLPSGGTLEGALGLLGADGSFTPVATAEPIALPAAGPPPVGPIEWLRVTPGDAPIVAEPVAHAERTPAPGDLPELSALPPPASPLWGWGRDLPPA